MTLDTTEVTRRIRDEEYNLVGDVGMADVTIQVEAMDDDVAHGLADEIAEAVHDVLDERE